MSTHNDLDILRQLDELNENVAEQDYTDSVEQELPDWVNKSNASYAGFIAIQELIREKKAFINSGKLSARTGKSKYTMTQREVAKKAGLNSHQTIFQSSTTSYRADITQLFNKANEKLVNLFKKKLHNITTKKTGNKYKTKQQLISDLQEVSKKAESCEIEMIDILYARLKKNIPVDIKRKLRLK